ncbi:DNA primase [Candidatus Roizmanbacteria bacterium CG_4_10_14_0_2_um_filter_36_35]|uniref:DNA primase n=3 Tax=Candidatus Roizmaniibacteriota TaxID=1752723 RepID=A0A2M7BWZ7_9BACT|nr:MAG: DNA primase [Candidatus Roizmanbacteria bacterium CG11_big_fil_rev_8_21_14_0_20_35_14]PIV11088.1 MAG: DNA primase [Candidatus Roizmanbacteria bacterium CG03_land_8_20_14_0_80_35_26]PIZ67881.1 MAG: DNA primase [Candidatus Roizmanbacteria bacterium CG_4_10_14_0_2_um_filter_36_35]PJC81011.1 MAG: DNA primase [Candidatus Roizmanbacteria bacterium CG_4_8_14_3_um_filter_36_12]
MDNPVEEIKKRLDIIEYIGSFISLKKAGRNFKAICPFHSEKTPSFVISPERQIWHCFGACGEGGDVIKFLMKWENITFIEALRELAQKTGITLKKISFEDKVWKKRERYFNMNLFAVEFFEYLLNKTKFGEKGMAYLKNRDIKPATIKKFQLGYAPSSWDSLRLFLKKKKFEEKEVYENGLLVKSERGSYYDRFRGRLMFPIKDSRDYVIGFSGRSLDEKDKQAKYINTPETPIYHKRETLFGINLAKETIKKEKNVYIVEGEFDVISPYQNGFINFVAVKGTALTNEQLMLLKRYTDKITLALDADIAGEESTRRGIEEAEKLDLEVRIVKLPIGKDPDEAVRTDLQAFKKAISRPIPIYDFLIKVAQKKYSEDTSFDKKKIGEEVIPFIERITNPIVRSHYVKKISSILGVSEVSIETIMSRIRRKRKQLVSFKPSFQPKSKEEREVIIERYLLSYIFQEEDPSIAAGKIFSIISWDNFLLPSHQKVAKFFLDNNGQKRFDLNRFVAKLSPELRQIFDELYLFSSSEHNLSSENISKLAIEIKRYYLKREIKKILAEKEESEKRKNELLSLSNNLKEIEKKLIS